MSDSPSLRTSAFVYGLAYAGGIGAMFLLQVVAGRSLGAEDFGRLSFALASATLLAPLLEPGLYYLMIREIARAREETTRFLAHALTWKLSVTPIFLLLSVLIVNAIHDSPATRNATYLIALSQVFLSAKDALRAALLGHERFVLDAVSLAIERFGLLFAAGAALLLGYDLIVVCWVFVAARVADFAATSWLVGTNVSRLSLGGDRRFVRELLAQALPIGACFITLTIYNYVDTVMLSALRNDAEVGWYSASYKLYQGPLLVPSLVGTIFLPRLSRLFQANQQAFRDILQQALGWLVMLSLLIAANGILFSSWLVLLSFGEGFERSIRALDMLLLGTTAIFLTNFLQTVMISVDRQRVILSFALVGLFANVALNAVAIPVYGYLGAAGVTVAVESAVCLALCAYVQRSLWKLDWWRLAGWPAVGVVVALGVTWGLGPDSWLGRAALLDGLILAWFGGLLLSRRGSPDRSPS